MLTVQAVYVLNKLQTGSQGLASPVMVRSSAFIVCQIMFEKIIIFSAGCKRPGNAHQREN